MKKKAAAIFMVAALAAMTVMGCGSSGSTSDDTATADDTTSTAEAESDDSGDEADATEASDDYSGYTIGLVQPGPENYYQTYFDRIAEAAELAGFETQTLLSEYDASTELSNVEDLISAGVDAIAIFPLTSDSAQQITQICNDADMPIFIVTTECADGDGVPTACIGNSFYDMGYQNGEWLIENLDQVGGEAKVLELQGSLGTGIGDEITRGFEEATADNDSITVVYQQDCQWDRDTAITNLEDQISAGTDFNVVFVHNEDMCGGVVSVLEEAGMLDDILVMTQNGSEDGFEMLEAGQIAMTVTNSPSLVAGETVVAIMKYFDGVLEENADIDAAVYAVDQTNWDDPDTVTWDSSWALNLVQEYLDAK